jgi:dTDP-4-amino-4,6-dideoxygalactose transaminase
LGSTWRHLSYSVPWSVPQWGWAELRATLARVLTGRARRGADQEHFVEAVRRYLGVRYAMGVDRGRTAIEIGLRAMGIGAGVDVVVPAYICASVVEGVERSGARVVYADVGADLNVTVGTIQAALTPATRCVIVPHLFGRAAAVDDIERSLAGTGIVVMDDAAQALGARRAGRMVGSFGACGIVACGFGKPLAGAAGGVLVTNDPALFERASTLAPEPEPGGVAARRLLAAWLWRRWRRVTLPLQVVLDRLGLRRAEPRHRSAGLANIDAAIGVVQLASLEHHAAARREHARQILAAYPWLRGMLTSDLGAEDLVLKLVAILPRGGPWGGGVHEGRGGAGHASNASPVTSPATAVRPQSPCPSPTTSPTGCSGFQSSCL